MDWFTVPIIIEMINWTLSIVALIATWASTRQKIWCFYLWICTNIGYIIYDIVLYQNPSRALLTSVQLWFCFVGIYEWSRIEKSNIEKCKSAKSN